MARRIKGGNIFVTFINYLTNTFFTMKATPKEYGAIVILYQSNNNNSISSDFAVKSDNHQQLTTLAKITFNSVASTGLQLFEIATLTLRCVLKEISTHFLLKTSDSRYFKFTNFMPLYNRFLTGGPWTPKGSVKKV